MFNVIIGLLMPRWPGNNLVILSSQLALTSTVVLVQDSYIHFYNNHAGSNGYLATAKSGLLWCWECTELLPMCCNYC